MASFLAVVVVVVVGGGVVVDDDDVVLDVVVVDVLDNVNIVVVVLAGVVAVVVVGCPRLRTLHLRRKPVCPKLRCGMQYLPTTNAGRNSGLKQPRRLNYRWAAMMSWRLYSWNPAIVPTS